MAIFVIFHSANPASLKTAVETSFPNDHLALGSSEWLISAAMAPIEVSDKLGISDGKNGSAIVFAMSGYFGRATRDIWDWIKAKEEKTNG